MKIRRLLAAAVLSSGISLPVSADAPQTEESVKAPREESTPRHVDRSSSNYQKTKQFLPGEEVVTPSGKKMKVWSTTGPVPVSPPPQPFEEKEEVDVDDVDVVIDARERSRRRGDNDEEIVTTPNRQPTGSTTAPRRHSETR